MEKKIKVIIAKPDSDGHDKGARIISNALRDAGMDVVYTGLHQSPEIITDIAIREKADFLGLSALSGDHMTFFPQVRDLLINKGAAEIFIFGGGIIPDEDIKALYKRGFKKIFSPGAALEEIISFIKETYKEKEKQKEHNKKH